MTFCPDCEADIPSAQFVAHRETEHPPAPMTLAVAGIKTQAAFGYDSSPQVFDPPDPED